MSVCVSRATVPSLQPHLSLPLTAAGKEIDCFDCNSNEDPRCGDPFVFRAHTRDMPPTKQCDGCCVKLVQHRGTGPDPPPSPGGLTDKYSVSAYESVRRTCTDEIDINLFMVDHVCMTEGGGEGHMCFCEENGCNQGRGRHQDNIWPSLSLVILTVIWTGT